MLWALEVCQGCRRCREAGPVQTGLVHQVPRALSLLVSLCLSNHGLHVMHERPHQYDRIAGATFVLGLAQLLWCGAALTACHSSGPISWDAAMTSHGLPCRKCKRLKLADAGDRPQPGDAPNNDSDQESGGENGGGPSSVPPARRPVRTCRRGSGGRQQSRPGAASPGPAAADGGVPAEPAAARQPRSKRPGPSNGDQGHSVGRSRSLLCPTNLQMTHAT